MTQKTTRLGYTFSDTTLWEQALVHSRLQQTEHSERLEHLGDSVLNCIVSEALYHQQPDADEGVLTRIRSKLVRRDALVQIAEYLELAHFFSEEALSENVLADTVEAIIGAILLDSNFDTVRRCVLAWYAEVFPRFDTLTAEKDAKTQLQEWTQAQGYVLPDYSTTTSGKSHEQTFHAVCRIEGLEMVGEARGSTRRAAEQAAAKQFLDTL